MGWLSRSCCYHLVFLQLFLLHSSLTHSKNCSNHQASLLLHFKQLFTDNYLMKRYWKEDTDCCSWVGVTCDDMGNGHVTGLHLSGLKGRDMQRLKGTIPSNSTLFLLPYLQDLDLSHNNDLKGSFPEAIWSNPLQILDVSTTNFSGQLPDSIGNLKSLKHLDVSSTSFSGRLPDSIGNLKSLTHLDVSYNSFSGRLPDAIGNLKSLARLNLRNCKFIGSVPASIGNLTQLTLLDLSMNNFTGNIPSSLSNLQNLSSLDLSINNFTGNIPSSLSNLQNLSLLDLSYNLLNGTIPSSLFTLPLLKTITLSFNQLEAIDIGENLSNSLQYISLDNNRLHGSIPSSFFELENLDVISLSSNNLCGILEPYMFPKRLVNLTLLNLSHNNLSLGSTIKLVNSSFQAPPNLRLLDLSDNKIHGKIPNWMWDMGKDTLYYLNLSHNFLTGVVTDQLPIQKNLAYLDLSSNLLQGKLPVLPHQLDTLLISKNQLTGEIPHYICNMSDLRVLDLSNNNMSGTIPECMGNINSYLGLMVIDLQNNSFSGTIPDTFAEGNDLETLNFNNNDLEGPVPQSLVNCTALQVLDLGNNKINDTFPHWLGILPELQVLVLRSNKFYGSVRDSKAKNSFSKLRILDLSKNNFSGSLPMKYFGKLKAMMNVGEPGRELYMDFGFASRYQYSIVVTMKGVDVKMEKILTIFTTMDFSSNKFRGQIPDVVGKLKFLKVLNFSHNDLIGYIPLSLENLIELESLDLYSNRLEGEIPKQLTSLTSLSALNLSYNQLVGHIPQGNQFNTFQNDSYIGNLGLCDFPLSKKCNNCEEPECKPDTPTIFHDEHDTASWFDWKMSLMGYGSGLVIGLSTGYTVFSTGKPEWIVNMVDRKYSRKVGRPTGRRRRRN